MPPTPPPLHDLLADARWVRRLARPLAGNAHDADDLVQDACLLALRCPPTHGENLRGWFRQVLRNLVRQNARASARRARRELAPATARPTMTEATDDLVERATTHRAVVDAVLALDEPLRATILLRFFEDLPPRAIAARLGVPVATVHSRLQRGCARLRQQLDANFGNRRRWCAALVPLPQLAATLPAIGVLVMNGKVLALAATLVVGATALWFGSDWFGTRPSLAPPAPAGTTVALEAAATAPRQEAAPDAAERSAAVPAGPPVADARPAARQVTGRVVDGEGHAVQAVRVELAQVGAGQRSSGEAAAPERHETRSDAAGAFTFAAAARSEGRVRVTEPGWQTVMHSVLPSDDTSSKLLVVVAPAVALAGQVRSADGLGIAGAALQIVWPADLRSRLSDIGDMAAEEHVSARSQDGGRFALGAARVRGAQLVVTAEGFVPDRRPVPEHSDQSLVITLERPQPRPGTIQGQVTDPRGVQVAGARIGLGTTLVTSDAQGNFLIDDDGKGRTLVATKAGHRCGAVERPAAGFGAFVLVTLGAAPLSVRGRVVDEDGKGLEGITVWINDPTLLCDARETLVVEGIAAGCASMSELREKFERGELRDPERVLRETPTASWPWVRSGADGSFVVTGLEERTYRLRAMDPRTLLMSQREGVAAGSADVVLQLRRDAMFAAVTGHVVARTGEVVPGVRVRAQIDTQRTGGSTMHGRTEAVATTDQEGRFTLRDLPKQHVYLRLDGDRILPLEFGRQVPGGLLELTGGDVEDLRIEVRVRMHVQVELLDPASADALAVLDGAGNTIIVNVFSGRGRQETDSLPLSEGKSPVFVVPDTAATLVLSKAGKKVRHAVLQLRADGVNTLRL
jgi:RNA polymerase sigma factor (sigma-70 family)